ncbi:glycosyltransferase family 4 protein [Paraburkholderia sartisoli]|uniref:Glycosyltransferase involved in cell wall bisynthesis n=1 Tax=Paraburkholderia sartisoli TaxID=83784 RepID=A0A1H4EDL0_9BURK|nr:glycosyltransferase family 4 protein [Paraburkholderia sartisoli]SEA82917.1 Glycosyltransferase involved in cell wall bisynthesis [Paraburkholderia sartisoli]
MNAPDLIRRFQPAKAGAAALPAEAGVYDGTRTPTVLFLDQTGQMGGAEFALLPLAEACTARGEVVLLADGPFRARLEEHGVHVKVLSDARVSNLDREAVRLNLLSAVPGILRQIRAIAREARRFDVLFVNTQKAMVLGALGKPLHRRPVIWFLHDIMSRAHFGRVQLLVVKWLARYVVDQVVANSRASAEALSALAGIPAERIPVIPNGIDAAAFHKVDAHTADDRAALRRRLGLPEDAYLAGLFGRLAPWKGQHIALQALAKLPDVHLVLVGAPLFGEHAYADGLRLQAEELGVTGRVHFAGFRDDMPAWMKAMDVILHTSIDPEPLGRVVIEGMIAERPVVAAAAGGVLEIVRDGHNGLLAQPGDVDGIVKAIDTVRLHPDVAQRLAKQGAIDAQRDFSLEAYVSRMTQAIARAAR